MVNDLTEGSKTERVLNPEIKVRFRNLSIGLKYIIGFAGVFALLEILVFLAGFIIGVTGG